MALERQALTLLLLFLILLTLSSGAISNGDGIAVYWGQNGGGDGTLSSTCASGNYKIVLLSFLNNFGCSRTASINFDSHCGPGHSPCTALASQIEQCQSRNVKVLLSLGGPTGSYSLCSPQDAKVVANYLYGNFLSGQPGPLGSVTLDGIHFDIKIGSNLYWDDLVNELNNIRQNQKNFYLSAGPQCFLPDPFLDTAIRTGNFDYVLVDFYNSPTCQYSPGALSLIDSWNAWTSNVLSGTTVFLGLPAAQDAAQNGGYIPPGNLVSDVLPFINFTSGYGGVALWDRSRDRQSRYSDQIKPYVSSPIPKLFSSDAI